MPTTLRNYIGGEWLAPHEGETLELTNPATGEPLGRVPLSGARDVDAAVAAAQAAFGKWRETPPVVRARYLFKLKFLMEQHFDDIAATVTRENGKTLDEARGSLRRGIENVEHACGIPALMMGKTLEDVAAGIDCEYVRQPLGVFAAVTPFNFPAMVPCWFWPYAIATGNTFILKPSEQVPFSPTRIVELAHEAGIPAGVLNLVMAAIASTLPETAVPASFGENGLLNRGLLEWRVLVVSFTLFLFTFGYGGLTSFIALYADANGVTPRGIYFTCLALTILATRPVSVPLADRIGRKKVLLPSLGLTVVGLALLSAGGTRPWLIASAVVFGAGFGTAYPVFAAHVTRHVPPARRGAAFGAILAAVDTGIGSGSICAGWIIARHGFEASFAGAAFLAALAVPFFLFAERRFLTTAPGGIVPSSSLDRPDGQESCPSSR